MPNYLLENVELEVDVEGFPKDLVEGIHVQVSKNSVMTCSITLVPSKGAIVGSSRLFSANSLGNFSAASAIGKDVSIKWKHSQGETTLFKGVVTGSSRSKVARSVQYQLNAQSGPLAMFQTSIGSRGICSWCPECDEEEDLYLFDELQKGNFTSPKTLLEEVLKALLSAHDSEVSRQPEGVQKVAPIIRRSLTQIQDELSSIKEPDILTRFWGIAGLLGDIKDNVLYSMYNWVKQQVGNTWIGFYNQILGTIDVKWTATKFGNLFLPDLSFTAAPAFNVIFPCMVQSISVNTDIFSAPAFMMMGFDTYPSSDSEYLRQALYEGQYIVYPENAFSSDIILPTFAANTFKLISPPASSEYFYKAAFDKDTAKEWEGKNYALSDIDGETPREIFEESTEAFKSWAQNWLAWHFYSERYGRNNGTVQIELAPNVTPGFNSIVFDHSTDALTMGMVESVTHIVTSNSAFTSLQLSNVISDKNQAAEIYNKLDNPIYVDAKSRITEIAQQTTGLSGGQVLPTDSPSNYLDYFDDPRRASNFMLRWQDGA